VNAVPNIANGANETNGKLPLLLIEGNSRLAVERLERAIDEIQKRATEIGPVLDEILHIPWNHWEINE
jgi:hypothetical protein